MGLLSNPLAVGIWAIVDSIVYTINYALHDKKKMDRCNKLYKRVYGFSLNFFLPFTNSFFYDVLFHVFRHLVNIFFTGKRLIV